ncbi:MAG: hypothetical protein M3Q49_21260 [Actinomycetota bacterium]|nr:hypothetical protein [Actinomycetota bacterium]
MPEDVRERLLAALWDSAEKACEERGQEATPELVMESLGLLLQTEMARSRAFALEFLGDEELERAQREEYERLSGGGRGVDEAELTAAMTERLFAKFPQLRGRP